MKYPDVVKLAKTATDGYGDKKVVAIGEIKAIFIRRHGVVQTGNMESVSTSATVYLDPKSEIALKFKDNLEGMYIQAEPFSKKDWYKIASVNIAQRKLINNRLDNIYCHLQKLGGVEYAD